MPGEIIILGCMIAVIVAMTIALIMGVIVFVVVGYEWFLKKK